MTKNSMARELAENWDEVQPVLDEMLDAAREGLARSEWTIGDSDEKFLLPIIGALTVYFGRELGVKDMPPAETMLRGQVARELRTVAARHPEGSARRAAFMEAAGIAEQGPR
ncbi:hypothetical protein [Streptomyces sp. NPDC050848]|uniref:hypothetical protein n=1 Tax=Streptomyces sp. NPDC050848 TaxID=3155791 RepID=UPI0033CF14CB